MFFSPLTEHKDELAASLYPIFLPHRVLRCQVEYSAFLLNGRYAYVTIHYEGTKRDDEYALAVRVWAKSLFDHGISICRFVNCLRFRAGCYYFSERECSGVYEEAVP